jgi:transposase-like protein
LTSPLERLNRDIARRSDVVGISPNDGSRIRLAGALLIEQNDERLRGRRYLSADLLAGLCAAWQTHAPRGPAPKRRVAVLLTAR